MRNAQLVAGIDELVSFWDGRSRGTLNTVVLAVDAGVSVNVFDTQGRVLPGGSTGARARRHGRHREGKAINGPVEHR